MNNVLNSSSIGIIGGADGPTAIFVAETNGFEIFVTVAVIVVAVISLALIIKKRKK